MKIQWNTTPEEDMRNKVIRSPEDFKGLDFTDDEVDRIIQSQKQEARAKNAKQLTAQEAHIINTSWRRELKIKHSQSFANNKYAIY